jgi:predicted CoA-binding protein
MSIDGLDDATIRDLLLGVRRIALIGASARPDRPSFGVLGFLLRMGKEVTPVYPGLAGQAILGRPVAADLAAAAPFEMVDVFRASEHVGPIVTEAARLGARAVWLQLGVVNEAAAAAGRAAGMTMVMDRCPAIEWRRLGLPPAPSAPWS